MSLRPAALALLAAVAGVLPAGCRKQAAPPAEPTPSSEEAAASVEPASAVPATDPAAPVATSLTPPPKATFSVPPDDELRRRLTPLQWKVTRENATETPFESPLWQNRAPGLYVCIVTGKPLFSSLHKLESSTGWPTFAQPLDETELDLRPDTTQFMTRLEVRAKMADTHLGHVFDDGPPPLRRRWVVNAAALRFIPLAEMRAAGYEDWLRVVDPKAR